MFENIDGKIKSLSIVSSIIGIVGSIFGGIIICFTDMGIGIALMVLGPILSWVSSFVLYGFGVLIEKVCEIAENTGRTSKIAIAQALEGNDEATQMVADVINEYKENEAEYIPEEDIESDELNRAKNDECPACFHKIAKTDKECTYCGYKLK